jgi:hypothetical protein
MYAQVIANSRRRPLNGAAPFRRRGLGIETTVNWQFAYAHARLLPTEFGPCHPVGWRADYSCLGTSA